jgi:small subunit ribosomal protein S18
MTSPRPAPLGAGPRGPRPVSGPGGRGRPGGRRFFPPRRRVCNFCVEKRIPVDYKDANQLRRYISDRGKIDRRRRTGTCAKHQRAIARAIKRARIIAILPFTGDSIRPVPYTGMRPRIADSPPASPPEEVGAGNSQLTVAQTEAKVEQQSAAEDSQDSVAAQTPPSVPAETSG